MPAGDKPYRVYRGGRVKGRVPLQGRPEAEQERDGRRLDGLRPKRARRRAQWKKRTWVGLVLTLLLVAVVVWAVASYLSFRSGVQAANKRLDTRTKAALTSQSGLLMSKPTTILLIGTDHANTDQRVADRHADSIMLVRTDPGRHRIAYLSVPRDLSVDIPGHGQDKINSAYQIGGPSLAIRTVESFTGIKVNHVVLLDFERFRTLIDDLGGITVNVPRPLLSDRFDCPYGTIARCQQWQGWRFAKGKQHMDGRRALIYSRIRVARNSNESDITRGERQQVVLQAIMDKATSPGTLLRLPWKGKKLLAPLATDLSSGQFLQLGWIKLRASSSSSPHCRLGGSAATIGGQSVITSTEENIAVVHMFLGESAPQPPPPGSGPYGPGCVVGNASLH